MSHTTGNIVRRNLAMAVDSNNYFTSCLPQSSIQAGGYDTPWVIDQVQVRILALQATHNIPSFISRHAVRYNHFQKPRRIVLRHNSSKSASNEVAFISHRHND